MRKHRVGTVFMAEADLSQVLATTGDGVLLRIKVVPGASRTGLAGLLGGRLKVRVAAPPEGGRANAAVCELIADLFGIPRQNVVVQAGHMQPQKSVALIGVSLCTVTERLRARLEG